MNLIDRDEAIEKLRYYTNFEPKDQAFIDVIDLAIVVLSAMPVEFADSLNTSFNINRKVKPCPFCGSTRVALGRFQDENNKEWSVYCGSCAAMLSSDVDSKDADDDAMINEAIKKWERRTPECKPL